MTSPATRNIVISFLALAVGVIIYAVVQSAGSFGYTFTGDQKFEEFSSSVKGTQTITYDAFLGKDIIEVRENITFDEALKIKKPKYLLRALTENFEYCLGIMLAMVLMFQFFNYLYWRKPIRG